MNIQLRVFRLFFLIILFGIQGCNPEAPEVPNYYPTANSTNTLVANPIPTNNFLTFTPSYDENKYFQKSCLDINHDILPSLLSNGVIVFENREVVNGTIARGITLFDLSRFEKTKMPSINGHFLDIKESPDQTRIAYQLVSYGVSPDSLVIANPTLEREKIISWREEWGLLLGWADNTHIIFRTANGATLNNTRKPPELIVFDINSLEETIFKPEFPELYDFHPLPYWDGFNTVIYNPDFTQAVYLRWTDSSHSTTYGLALWDVKNQEMLMFQTVAGYPMPKWSPNSSEFITTGLIDLDYKELFSISKSGEIKQLTHIGNNNADIEIMDYVWSPDGKHIALILKQNLTTATVAILNIDSMLIKDFCIQVTFKGGGFGKIPSPIWSPNSQQLIIEDWYEQDHRKIVLIDIIQNYAIQIAEDVEPSAWLLGK